MGHTKSIKGTVSVTKNKDRIRLRWRYLAKRYSLTLNQYTKLNLVKARKIAVQIEEDILAGAFDSTLIKYSSKHFAAEGCYKPLYQQFEAWAKAYKNKDCEVDKPYNSVRNMLKRWGEIQIPQVLERLNQQPLNEHTYNRRLKLLQHFFQHQKKHNLIPINPLEGVSPKKEKRSTDSKRTPFTEVEITNILSAIRNDTYARKKGSHSHYYPFVYFIFQLGVRNAEAIGLRVKYLNFEKRIVEIREVLARTVKGSNPANRVRKETKNGKYRVLPLDDALIETLRPLVAGKQQDDLVFLSPKGLPIDDRQFQQRIFRKVLEELNVPIRVLYACRHTFASRCIEHGMTPVMTAFLLGNNAETALRHYTHLLELPKQLPSISGKAG
jgi:integrase